MCFSLLAGEGREFRGSKEFDESLLGAGGIIYSHQKKEHRNLRMPSTRAERGVPISFFYVLSLRRDDVC